MSTQGKPVMRWVLLLTALGATFWLTQGGEEPKAAGPTTKAVARTPPSSNVRTKVDEPISALLPRAALYDDLQGAAAHLDLFAARAPLAPSQPLTTPTAAVSEVRQAQPVLAQSFEFRVLGKKQEAGRWEVFLERDGRTLFAQAGAELEGGFRVDVIDPPTMKLTHVATNTPINISIGAPQ